MIHMFCRNCGVQVQNQDAHVCLNCGGLLNGTQQPKFYTAGFVLGILALCIPFYGFILGIIGLVFGCLSKRKSAIIMNSIAIGLTVLFWIGFVALVIWGSFYAFENYHYFDSFYEAIQLVPAIQEYYYFH